MSGPGEYLPDLTEKLSGPAELPQPTVKYRPTSAKNSLSPFANALPDNTTRHRPTKTPPPRRSRLRQTH